MLIKREHTKLAVPAVSHSVPRAGRPWPSLFFLRELFQASTNSLGGQKPGKVPRKALLGLGHSPGVMEHRPNLAQVFCDK